MDTLNPKNSRSITFTVRDDFFTFWGILAHSVAPLAPPGTTPLVLGVGHTYQYFRFQIRRTPSGVIELRDIWPQLRCTAPNIFMVVSMI